MSKIEEKLLINEPSDSMLLIAALDDFYREANMLFNNIYLSQTIFNPENKKIFPLQYDFYDASWYKNLLISAQMLIDRFHYEIDFKKNYDSLFDSLSECDFLAFAKKWNTINYIVKFNLDENTWKVKSTQWKLAQTTIWINELLTMNIKIDKGLFDTVSLNTNAYEPFADAIGRNGYDQIINYILNPDAVAIENKKQHLSTTTQATGGGALSNASKPEKDIDPRSPEGVEIEMTKLLEWVLLKQATIRARNAADRPEQKEVSPMRKVMIELIDWVDQKQSLTRTWKNIGIYGFDPYEYVDIINDLKQLLELRDKLNKDVDACLEFATNNNPDIRLKPTKQIWRKYYKHIRLEEEALKAPIGNDLIKKLEKLNKELKETNKLTGIEIKDIEAEILKLNDMLPPEEKLDLYAEGFYQKANQPIDSEQANNQSTPTNETSEQAHDNNSQLVEDKQEFTTILNAIEGEKQMPSNNPEFKELINDNEINDFIKDSQSKNIDELANEKVRIIDKELKKINKIISTNKKDIEKHLDRPISKVKDEMDQILIWIGIKCEELRPLFDAYGYVLEGDSPETYIIRHKDDILVAKQEDNNEKEKVIKKPEEKNAVKNSKNAIKVVKKQNVIKAPASKIPEDQKHTIIPLEYYLYDYNYDARRKEWHKKAGHNDKQLVCWGCKDDDNWETILLDNNKHICYYCWITKPKTAKKPAATKKQPNKNAIKVVKKQDAAKKLDTSNSLKVKTEKKPDPKTLKIKNRSSMNQIEELYYQALAEKKKIKNKK